MRRLVYLSFLFLLPAALHAQALIKDINPGLKGSSPQQLTYNGTLYFVADDGIHGKELWKSDGTQAGTVLVKDIVPGPESSDIREMTNVNGMLYFSAVTVNKTLGDQSTTRQLWRSNGTSQGTVVIPAGHKFSEVLNPIGLTAVGSDLYYVKFNALGGTDHWRMERVSNAEDIAKQVDNFDFSPQTDGYHPPTDLTNVNGSLYFSYKGDLWKTASGAPNTIVKAGIKPKSLVSYKGALFFTAGLNHAELWTSAGTQASTQKVASAAGPLGAGIDSIVVAGQYLFFTAGQGGKDLWVSSGTAKSSKKLSSFTGPAHEITNLSSTGQAKTDKTYFTAGPTSELFVTDGSSVTKVKGVTSAHLLTRSKGAIYFTSGTNLFKTSSTTAELVASSSFYSFNLTDAHNRLFFSHDNPGMGFELYWLEAAGGFPPF